MGEYIEELRYTKDDLKDLLDIPEEQHILSFHQPYWDNIAKEWVFLINIETPDDMPMDTRRDVVG